MDQIVRYEIANQNQNSGLTTIRRINRVETKVEYGKKLVEWIEG